MRAAAACTGAVLISTVLLTGCGSEQSPAGLDSDRASASETAATGTAGTVTGPGTAANPIPKPQGVLELKFNAGEELDTGIAEAAGTLYFSADGKLFAVDEATGQERWRFPAGERIQVTPRVDGATVYFASNQYPSGERTGFHVRALDTVTGQEKWQFAAGSDILALEVASGTVYAAGTDNLYALDAVKGQHKWSQSHGAMIMDTADPSILYLADMRLTGPNQNTTYVYAVDKATGAEKWKMESGGAATDLQNFGGLVYLATFGDRPGGYRKALPPALFALDASTGQQKWMFAPEAGNTQPYGDNQMLAISHVDGRSLFVIDNASDLSSSLVPSVDRTVYEFDAATGQQSGSYRTAGGFQVQNREDPAPTYSDGVFYLVNADLGNAANDPNARITYIVSAVAAAGGAEQWTVRAQAGTRMLLSYAGLFNGRIWLAARDSGEIFVLR